MTCLARHLVTAFEIISKLGNIGTFHNIHAVSSHAHYFTKSRQQFYNIELLTFKAHERFTFIGYIVTKLLKNSCYPWLYKDAVCRDKSHSQRYSALYLYHSDFSQQLVHVANNLKWTQHVDAISSKVSSRLYFLKQLKRSGAGPEDFLCYYITVVRPVLEYACPLWYSSLTAAQLKVTYIIMCQTLNQYSH